MQCAVLLVFVLAACSEPSGPTELRGRIVSAVTIDWEGAYVYDDNLAALEQLHDKLPGVPFTHFVSAAYLTNGSQAEPFRAALAGAFRPGDELAVHLHLWHSLARTAGVSPRLSPSFLSGTEDLLRLEHGDIGFDLDLDTHTVAELRALLRTSRQLLASTGLRVSSSHRAGGYLATPKVMLALRSEGFTVDSSAVNFRQLEELADTVLPVRLAELWPNVSEPFPVTPDGALLELPIAAVSDYASESEIVAVFEHAQAQLRQHPTRDTFLVLACHFETAAEDAGRLGDAVAAARSRSDLARDLLFTTVESAAELVRFR